MIKRFYSRNYRKSLNLFEQLIDRQFSDWLDRESPNLRRTSEEPQESLEEWLRRWISVLLSLKLNDIIRKRKWAAKFSTIFIIDHLVMNPFCHHIGLLENFVVLFHFNWNRLGKRCSFNFFFLLRPFFFFNNMPKPAIGKEVYFSNAVVNLHFLLSDLIIFTKTFISQGKYIHRQMWHFWGL